MTQFGRSGKGRLTLALVVAIALSPLVCLAQWSGPSVPESSIARRGEALRVVSLKPADGSQEVKRRDMIEVIFDRPMVAGRESGAEAMPFVISPAARGQGVWTAADTFRFRPDGLKKATRYTVTVPAGTRALDGAVLQRDYVVTFSTVRPAVTSVRPQPGALSVDPGGSVQVTFNMMMEQRSVESRLRLLDANGRPVEGAYRWGDKGYTVTFTPAALLERWARYRLTLAAGARPRGKELPIAEDLAWEFTVAGPPCIVFTSPADGDMAAYPEGRLVIQFNVPMDIASVEKALSIEPEPAYVNLSWGQDETRLEAYVDFDPSAEYRILLGEGVQDRYGEPLTGNRSIVFRSAPLAPMLSLYGPDGYYQGRVGSHVADGAVEQFVEVRNLEAVTFTLSAIAPADFRAGYRDRYTVPETTTISRTHLYTWRQSLDLPLNKIRYISTTVAGPDGQLPAGIYLLEVQSGRLRDARFMVVSRANLSLKWGPRQVFVWATDLVSGEVIPGMRVAVYRGDGTLLAEGVTDRDGVFLAQAEVVEGDYWRRWEEDLFVVGEGPHGLALCAGRWDQGITVWDFGLPQDYGGDNASVAYFYTDRPIYRPGQTVYFKGILRADDDGRYALLDGQTVVPVSIFDSYGNELFAGELPLGGFGTVHGELTLADTAPLGQYTLQSKLPGRQEPYRAYFTVAEYRKPEFEVKVLAEVPAGRSRPYAVHGETITVTVQADYYFGQPVPDTAVRWTLRGSPYRFSLPDTWYSFGPYGNGWWYYGDEVYDEGRMVYASGTGTTDANGQFVFTIPVDLSQSQVSQVFVIEAVLVDVNDQEVAGRAVVVAHKTDTYLGVKPRRYVGRPGEAQPVDLIALDPLRQPRAGVAVTVEFSVRRWDTVREKIDTGGYVWRNTVTTELLSTQVVTITADGKAQALVTPREGGEYKIVARAVDGMGNEILSETYLWVWSQAYVNWGVNNHDRIQLVADKPEYRPGDVAEVLVTAPFSGCLALVTVERGGVLHYDVQRLEGTSALLRVPITADYAPNAFLSVTLVKGRDAGFPTPVFKLGYVELRVALRERQLNIAITPDKERYQPGETAIYTIRATDHLGRGVSAELSVGVVDAAVLALLGDNSVPILDAFYYRRGLAVWNAQTLVISADRLNEALERGGKGGGGGEGGDDGVRSFFRDTAYWNPVVFTDADGWAVVRVALPDDLTTWRVRVKGLTVDTRVGDGSADVVSTKDLLVRPVLPRFLTVGDEVGVAALVHNYTGITQTVQVVMETTGLEATGGQEPRVVVVAAGGVERVAWRVNVPKGREVKVRFSARALGATPAPFDAVEIALPVRAYAETTTVAGSQRVEERLVVPVELPDDADRLDELVIETAPSLGAGIRTGLEYLTGYPYG